MVKITVKAALAVFMLLASISPALAGVVGKFTSIEGRVDVLKPGQKRAAPVTSGFQVSEGDIVRTKSGSFAEITFEDDTVLRLTQSTRIEISEYLLNGNKRENGALKLLRGKVRATVSKGLGRVIPVIYSGPTTFRIQTPTAVAGVKGTDFFVSYSMGTTGVFVLEGAVDTMGLSSPEHVVRVRGGEFSVVERNLPATSPASAREFVLSKHLRDALPGARESREGRDSKESLEEGRATRASGRAEEESRLHADDTREFRGELDRVGRDFKDYEKDGGGVGGLDDDRYDTNRYEQDYHHQDDYDRPISEVNTALLDSYFKGAIITSTTSGVNISAQADGKLKDDFTWWAYINGVFNNATGNHFNGTFSGTTSAGSFTGNITNGSWQGGTWSADVSGTLPGGTFTGTLEGRHDPALNGKLDGAGSGQWTTGSATVN